MSLADVPRSPADPRDGEPYYIDSHCPDCGTALVLWDDLFETDGKPFYDEWVCPECVDGCHMDWPDEEFQNLQ